MDEALVGVTTEPGSGLSDENYVYVDWGTDFRAAHHAAFPDAASPALSINHGPLALEYILAVGGSGYFRMQAAHPYLESGRLHLVPNAPRFSYSVYAVYSAKADEQLMERVRSGLRSAARLSHRRTAASA